MDWVADFWIPVIKAVAVVLALPDGGQLRLVETGDGLLALNDTCCGHD